LLIIYSLIFVAAIAFRVAAGPRRTRQGVSGRSRRRDAYLGAVMGSAYVAHLVFQGALKYLGASPAIVWGVYPAVVSPIVLVAAGGVFAAVHEDRQTLWAVIAVIAVIAVLAGSAFAGPIGVWLSCGVGGFIVLVALAAVQFRQRRP
jgi:cytochrome b